MACDKGDDGQNGLGSEQRRAKEVWTASMDNSLEFCEDKQRNGCKLEGSEPEHRDGNDPTERKGLLMPGWVEQP